ncbi:MAG: PaaI family thioesterase [Pseudonocardia sp.]|nr:PaaI family thioesterase [Pseudonocardia sp.]
MTDVRLDRERAYSWDDPRGMAAGAELDGLTLLRRVADGSLPAPPIAQTMGFDLESVERGRAVFVLTPAEYHYNPIGSVHGGVYATLLDSACGCAVHSTLPAGVRYTSVDLNVKFLGRMTTDTGLVRCEGWIVHGGRSTVLARAELRNEAGRLLGEATSTCLILH